MSAERNTAVDRALEILEILGRATEGLRLRDIANGLDLPESTVHRLLASLGEKGFVRQREPNGRYLLGWKIVTLAQRLRSEARLIPVAHPHLEILARRIGQTVNLGVLRNTSILYLDCVPPGESLSLYAPPGWTAPAYATALGKALLAYLPDPELSALLAQIEFDPLTPNTIQSVDALRTALEDVRARGVATDRGELRADLACLAAPIRGPTGEAHAAISVTVRATDVPPDWQAQTMPTLRAAAEQIAADLFR